MVFEFQLEEKEEWFGRGFRGGICKVFLAGSNLKTWLLSVVYREQGPIYSRQWGNFIQSPRQITVGAHEDGNWQKMLELPSRTVQRQRHCCLIPLHTGIGCSRRSNGVWWWVQGGRFDGQIDC